MLTCNQLDLGTLGYRLVVPKNLRGHWTTMHSVIEKSTWNSTWLVWMRLAEIVAVSAQSPHP